MQARYQALRTSYLQHVRNDQSPPEGFGEFLREARVRARLTAAQLAEASGLNQTQISNWEAGKNQPSIPNLRKIAPHVQVPVAVLAVRAGHFTEQELQVREYRPQTPEVEDVAEAIRQDADLIDEARAHLLNQYQLLRRLSDSSGSQAVTPLRGRKETPSRPTQRQAARRGKPETET